jgi:RNA polymerase sigma-70 factor (ECF subfamily)
MEALPDAIVDARRVDDDYARREEQRRVADAVATLPPHLRVPLVLRHHEDLSYAEIAEVLDIAIGTVASRLSRAHAALAHTLTEERHPHGRFARRR